MAYIRKTAAECEKLRAYNKEYYWKNRDKKLAYKRANKEKTKVKAKEYRIKTADKRKQYNRKYIKNKRATDPLYKLRTNISNAIRCSFYHLKTYKKNKTVEILGCDFKFLKQHLENTFKIRYKRLPELNESIHIDHIIPLVTAKNQEDLLKLNHYTNLQWLTAEDNLKKSDKII